jgi:folate-binding Fe-S cluster repair protein YgfZ
MSETAIDQGVHVLSWSRVVVRGPESESFLQGQLSQDLAGLNELGAWALLLAPDSVVLTTCFVVPRDDGFDLVVPRSLAGDAATRLRRFLLRSKCTIEIEEADHGPIATVEEQIERRWPGEREFALSLTPHSFGRAFVDATVSFTKGCFTGQELVGRLDARGSSVPWRFVFVKAPSLEDAQEFLTSKGPEGPRGVTSAATKDGRFVGLGIAHRTLVAALLTHGDVTIEEIN